jgi:hypothetical protein
MSKEHCQLCHLLSIYRDNDAVKESLQTRILIAKARSDNSDLVLNFADKIHAIPLQNDVR